MLSRPARPDDAETWASLRSRLWPAAAADELAAEVRDFLAGKTIPTLAAVFIVEEPGTALGFLELSVRAFSDRCESMPVPYVEGWYVEPFARRRGVGRALMSSAERWARERLVKFCKTLS